MAKHNFDRYRVIGYDTEGMIQDVVEFRRDSRRGWKKRDAKKYVGRFPPVVRVRVEKVKSRAMCYIDFHR